MSAFTKRWLMLYVLFLATLAFLGRAIPLSFLTLVLQTEFHQSDSMSGVIMALYPLAALLATPVAARIARGTRRIVILHSASLLMIAGALALSALAPTVKDSLGNAAGTWWLAIGRALQGVGASFYLSSNTCLLSRKFPEKLAYIIALTEVCVGVGGQTGRLAGAFLFDLGGFSLPFLVVAVLQAFIALGGFFFEDLGSGQAHQQRLAADQTQKATLPWSTLVTPRLCAGAAASFVSYFFSGFLDTTLIPYMSVHLAPISVGEMGLATSVRSLSYLFASSLLVPLMRNEALSSEFLIASGSAMLVLGLLLMAPQPCVFHLYSWLYGSDPSREALLGLMLVAFLLVAFGSAVLFVPSLPLMQHEVRKHGQVAIEQVAELFVIMLNFGEMAGPIAGGWLVQELGFPLSTLLVAVLPLVPLVLGIWTYDRDVIRARRSAPTQGEAIADGDVSATVMSCGPRCGVPSDGEANYAVRRLVFAIDFKYNDCFIEMPSSAPADTFRRRSEQNARPLLDERVPQTAPSQTFRKQYEPPASRSMYEKRPSGGGRK